MNGEEILNGLFGLDRDCRACCVAELGLFVFVNGTMKTHFGVFFLVFPFVRCPIGHLPR